LIQDIFILYFQTLEKIKIDTRKFISKFSDLNSNLQKIYNFELIWKLRKGLRPTGRIQWRPSRTELALPTCTVVHVAHDHSAHDTVAQRRGQRVCAAVTPAAAASAATTGDWWLGAG
jgi:hypothetical protein